MLKLDDARREAISPLLTWNRLTPKTTVVFFFERCRDQLLKQSQDSIFLFRKESNKFTHSFEKDYQSHTSSIDVYVYVKHRIEYGNF